jgi:hypothetical protein
VATLTTPGSIALQQPLLCAERDHLVEAGGHACLKESSTMSIRILLAADDAFQCGYVASGLLPLGATIIGPVSAASAACSLIEEGAAVDAVIMFDRLADGSAEALLSMVRLRQIPHLVLLEEQGPLPRELAPSPVLQRPFASFQVADWVTSLGQQSCVTPAEPAA